MDPVLFHPRTFKFSGNWEFETVSVWDWMFWALMEFVWHFLKSVLLPLQSLRLLLPSKNQASAWIMKRSSLVFPPCARDHLWSLSFPVMKPSIFCACVYLCVCVGWGGAKSKTTVMGSLLCQPYGVHIYYVIYSQVKRPITQQLQPDVHWWDS